MAWKKYIEFSPEKDGEYKCKMKDGSEIECIFHLEYDWNENEMSHFYWRHWFLNEQDKKDWSPLEEEDEPEYWWDGV